MTGAVVLAGFVAEQSTEEAAALETAVQRLSELLASDRCYRTRGGPVDNAIGRRRTGLFAVPLAGD